MVVSLHMHSRKVRLSPNTRIAVSQSKTIQASTLLIWTWSGLDTQNSTNFIEIWSMDSLIRLESIDQDWRSLRAYQVCQHTVPLMTISPRLCALLALRPRNLMIPAVKPKLTSVLVRLTLGANLRHFGLKKLRIVQLGQPTTKVGMKGQNHAQFQRMEAG